MDTPKMQHERQPTYSWAIGLGAGSSHVYVAAVDLEQALDVVGRIGVELSTVVEVVRLEEIAAVRAPAGEIQVFGSKWG